MKNLQIYSIGFILLLLCFFFSCKPRKEKIKNPVVAAPVAESISTAPSHCRIIGKVIAISEERNTEDPESPCFKAACKANIYIESVIGYGSAFTRPLVSGEKVNVNFAYTLNKTDKQLFPGLQKPLPGLSIGSRFSADIESRIAPDGKDNFWIYHYELIH